MPPDTWIPISFAASGESGVAVTLSEEGSTTLELKAIPAAK
jgi:hypothetical protein